VSSHDDYGYYEQELAMEKFLDDSLKQIAEDNVRLYLGTYGDAVEERTRECVKLAKELQKANFHGSSLSLFVTAIELLIRFMLLRPLMQGAFLSDEWAEILSNRIAAGRSSEDRKMLPAILQQWGIDINSLRTKSNRHLWSSIQDVIKKRHGFVHSGKSVAPQDSQEGLEAVDALLTQVLIPLAEKLGFSLSETGKWHKIDKRTPGGGEYHTSFTPGNPFDKE